MTMKHRACLAIMMVASPVAAQERLPAPRSAAADTDIVITGDIRMPVNPKTIVAAPPVNVLPGIDKAATYADASRRAAACATRGQIAKLSLLREVVDGVVSTPSQERAQDWLVRQTAACGEGAAIAWQGGNIGAGGRASADDYLGMLYRGAFIAETIKAFAPDIMLTREQLADTVVQQRFLERETARAVKRLPFDRQYFKMTVCMVREQPELAARLVRTDPVTSSTTAIQANLIERARGCAGNPKRVVVDRYQFRNYVADALYRWILAVRDVDTLVPPVVTASR